ncbi:MAG: DUF4465 domain-containing protein [Flavobacteriaceae bacterium]|nr:DUF4465 domain-containing protein [Flavobacteriaceae bacterium]
MTKTIYTLAFVGLSLLGNAQTAANFENITLLTNTYWNGSDTSSGGFRTGNCWLNNKWDTAFGGNWSGFAVSNMQDSVTSGFGNQYSSANGKGHGKSSHYGVGFYSLYHPTPSIVLTGQAAGKELRGFWVSNTTYAYLDMKNGSSFSKKFGGASGTDSDWFKLTVWGYKGGVQSKSVEFLLADFRDSSSAKDYIVKNWRWVDCKPLGNVDSVHFTLSSSDVGSFGMNTPAYFAIDGIITNDFGTGISDAATHQLSMYPNPTNDNLFLSKWIAGARLSICDVTGREVYSATMGLLLEAINMQAFSNGFYLVKMQKDNEVYMGKVLKN